MSSQKNEGFIPKKGPDPEINKEYDKINVRSGDDPKWISIGKTCSPEEKDKLKSLLTNFKDVFAWSYDDLKNFGNGEYRNYIPLKPEATPFRKKLRNYNLKVSEVVLKEVENMIKARTIYPIHHSTWVANIVLV